MDLRREELAPHLTKDCPKREVVCQHCKKGFASDSIEVSQPLWFRDSSNFYLKSTQFAIYSCNRIIHIVSHASPLQSHFVECEEFPVACDYCQLIMPNRKSVSLYTLVWAIHFDDVYCVVDSNPTS